MPFYRDCKFFLRGRVKHMRKFTKILLPVLCVVALMACTFGSLGVLSVSAAGIPAAEKAQSILDKYDVNTTNGMKQVGVANDGTVTGIVVKEMHETLGLGMNGLTDWQFLAQYLRTSGEAEVGTNVDALTGATVTSKAITRCVNSAVAVVTGADADSGATSWGG